MRRHLIAVLALCGGLLIGGAAASAAQAAAPLTFYQTAPAGWQSKPVGTLLKWQRERHSWPALTTLKGYRIMYVSRGALDEKVFETGMVYLPTSGSAPRGGRRVMAWDHGTSGVGDSAAPSRYPWLYPEPDATPWDWYAQWVGKLGRMGYVVTCPDYEGLGTPGLHTYLNAGAEGRATIDAVRAARELSARLGVRTSRRWGVAGHSQGGQAALAAAEIARTSYGDGLSLRATVAVCPAVEIATINAMSAADAIGWPYVGYTAWGIRAIDPSFDFSTFCGPWLTGIIDQAPDNYYDGWWALCLGAHWIGVYPDGSPGAPTLTLTVGSLNWPDPLILALATPKPPSPPPPPPPPPPPTEPDTDPSGLPPPGTMFKVSATSVSLLSSFVNSSGGRSASKIVSIEAARFSAW